jgi:hypothetical protein
MGTILLLSRTKFLYLLSVNNIIIYAGKKNNRT